MDGDGNIYTGSPIEVHHHSAFLAGQPAAAAGLWGVTDGKLVWINGESGHYMPPGDYSEQILTELKKRGVKLKDVEKDFFIDSKKCAVGRKKRAGIKGLKWWQREKGAVKVTDYVEGLKDAKGNPIEDGSHIKGQVLRLYPGKKPEWSWF